MRIKNSPTRRGGLLAIALFASLQIIRGFFLIMDEVPASVQSHAQISQEKTIKLSFLSDDLIDGVK